MTRMGLLAAVATLGMLAWSAPGSAMPHHRMRAGLYGHRGGHAMTHHRRYAGMEGRGLHRGWTIGRGNPHRHCFWGVGYFGGGCR